MQKKNPKLELLENKIRKMVKEEMLKEAYDPKITTALVEIIEPLFDRYFRGSIKDPGKIKNFCTQLAEDIQSDFKIEAHPF